MLIIGSSGFCYSNEPVGKAESISLKELMTNIINNEETSFVKNFSSCRTNLKTEDLINILIVMNRDDYNNELIIIVLKETLSRLVDKTDVSPKMINSLIKPMIYYSKCNSLNELDKINFQKILNLNSLAVQKNMYSACIDKIKFNNFRNQKILLSTDVNYVAVKEDVNKGILKIISILEIESYDIFINDYFSQNSKSSLLKNNTIDVITSSLKKFSAGIFVKVLNKALKNIHVTYTENTAEFVLSNLEQIRLIKENNIWKIDYDPNQVYSYVE